MVYLHTFTCIYHINQPNVGIPVPWMLWVWIYGKIGYFSKLIIDPVGLPGVISPYGPKGDSTPLTTGSFGAQVVKPMGMDDLWKCLVIQVVIF